MINSPKDTQLVRGRVGICLQDDRNPHPSSWSFSPEVYSVFSRNNFGSCCFCVFLNSLICILIFLLLFYFLWVYFVVPFVTSWGGSELVTFQPILLSALEARNFPVSTAVVASRTFGSVGVYYSTQNFFWFSYRSHAGIILMVEGLHSLLFMILFWQWAAHFHAHPSLGIMVPIAPSPIAGWLPVAGPSPVGLAKLEAMKQ